VSQCFGAALKSDVDLECVGDPFASVALGSCFSATVTYDSLLGEPMHLVE
jgi:hypothetical protein